MFLSTNNAVVFRAIHNKLYIKLKPVKSGIFLYQIVGVLKNFSVIMMQKGRTCVIVGRENYCMSDLAIRSAVLF